jgi:signal transduction histidine kinase
VNAELLVQLATHLVFVLILFVVLRNLIRDRYRASVHIVLFFGALVLALSLSWIPDLLAAEPPGWFARVVRLLLVALPYLLLRIVSDFADVSPRLLRGAEAGLALAAGAVLVWEDLPAGAVVGVVAYFVGFHAFAAVRFLAEAGRAHGVTRRRMQSAAGGTALFGVAILIAGVGAAAGAPEGWGGVPLRLSLLGAALAYLVGFVPPAILRRAWQEPELRGFLRRVAELPWLEDLGSTIRGIEAGAAASFGVGRATVVLWDPESETLRLAGPEGDLDPPGTRPGELIAGRAFLEGRAMFAPDAAKADPANAAIYRDWNASAIVSAPIAAGGERLGVLSVYGPRAPVFAADDLDLVQLLADQAAIVLKNRRLLEETAEARAKEEAMRTKDDFLSAAAHDLRTPLQTILGTAQVLERRAAVRPEEPVHVESLRRISREAKRLNELVARLLDVGRAETAQLVGEDREPTALDHLARRACERHSTDRHPCVVQAESPVLVPVDAMRMSQVFENLIENGKKYSPQGGEITVRVWREPGPGGGEARVSVRDRGIGIPRPDFPHVFERFRRAGNVDDRRFSGMGLGLYICRIIVEQHAGRIWLESRLGEGSTFHLALPLAARVPPQPPESEA